MSSTPVRRRMTHEEFKELEDRRIAEIKHDAATQEALYYRQRFNGPVINNNGLNGFYEHMLLSAPIVTLDALEILLADPEPHNAPCFYYSDKSDLNGAFIDKETVYHPDTSSFDLWPTRVSFRVVCREVQVDESDGRWIRHHDYEFKAELRTEVFPPEREWDNVARALVGPWRDQRRLTFRLLDLNPQNPMTEHSVSAGTHLYHLFSSNEVTEMLMVKFKIYWPYEVVVGEDSTYQIDSLMAKLKRKIDARDETMFERTKEFERLGALARAARANHTHGQ